MRWLDILGKERGFGARMPRRDRCSQDIRQGAGVAVGDGACQREHLGSEDGEWRGDALERSETGVLALVHALNNESVDESSGKPHPHPDAGLRLGIERLGDGVVEEPVQVSQRHVHRYTRHPVRHGTIVPGGCDVVSAVPA